MRIPNGQPAESDPLGRPQAPNIHSIQTSAEGPPDIGRPLLQVLAPAHVREESPLANERIELLTAWQATDHVLVKARRRRLIQVATHVEREETMELQAVESAVVA